MISELIQAQVDQGFDVRVVYTEGGVDASCSSINNKRKTTFLLLDGTWQEAKTLYRRGPLLLRQLPRVALSPNFSSTYRLRGDYGWRNKFGDIETKKGLLCTAEAVACIFDECEQEDEHVKAKKGEEIRARLEAFQQQQQQQCLTRS